MTAPKKIILLVIDTLRADHLGCYGYARNTSPNIDHLAAESIVFERAFTPVSYTLPAIASMLTSKRPDSHGIGLSQDGKFSGDSDLTLAELLSDNGYSTAAFVSTVVLRKATKLDLGFDVYDDKMTAEELNRPDYTLREGRATIARALEYIKRHKENDLFILIHLMDVHGPYICPPPYDAQFVDDPFYGEKATLRVVPDNHPYSGIPAYQVLGAPGAANGDGKGFINDPRVYRARYDGCIRNCDDIVASLLNGLKVLGIYDDTLFILTADHGEALGENDIYFFHGVTVTPEQISVPLLIKPSVHHVSGPKKPATHVSTIDLMPTILAACGIDWAGLGLHGRSLQLLIENGTDPGLSHRTLLSENECQDAFIRPDGTLKLEKSSRPFRGYYAHVPEVIDQLDGSQFSWRTGKKIGVITALRKSKMLKLKRAFFIEPLSLKKLAHIAYFFVSIVLPPALKHRIMPLARRLRSRFGDPELISAQAKPHEVRLAVQTESQRPRILHALADFGADGSSRLAVDLIERLGDSYEQEILTGLLPKTPSYIGVHASEINQDAAAGAFVNHIAAFRPALLHVHYKGGVDNRWYPKIFQAAERYGGRIIETIHTPTAPCFSEAVNRYVYVSNFIRTRYGPHDNKSIVIYPGMNFENLSCFENATIMDDCIGTVYRHERERLDEYLIDPFIAIAKKRPSTGFLIAGNGVLLKPFRTAVRHEGVESQFRFTDYTSYSELARFFSRMAVFIAPILQESFDPVIPFAMFTGIPVVGYDMEALPEILGDRELLAPAGDSEALTGIIDQLLDDTQRRISIGRSNRERMVSEFTVESMAEKYRSLYAEAIAGCNIFHDGSIASPAPSSAIAAADPQMNAGTRPVARRTGLKVALFVHCFFPDHFLGTETYTLQVADNLRRMGHEPVVVSAVFQGESKQSQMVTQHVYDGIQVYSIDMNYAPASCIRETYYHEALRSVFRDLLQQIRPDLVHVTHLINHTAVLLEVADNLGLPIVGTMTDFYGFCFNCRLQAVDGSICRGPNSSRTNCIACSLKSGGQRIEEIF